MRLLTYDDGSGPQAGGDVIATGTPAGVGASKNRFLQSGDLVEVEVEGLGVLANPVHA